MLLYYFRRIYFTYEVRYKEMVIRNKPFIIIMKSLYFSLAFILAALSAPAQTKITGIVISHVNIVDVANGGILTDKDVLIKGNRITAIAPGGTKASSRQLNGNGKYLVPGFWDMHIHITADMSYYDWTCQNLRLLILNGITGFREPFGELATNNRVREANDKGIFPSPRFVVSGHILDGYPAVQPQSTVVTTTSEAMQAVNLVKLAGTDFIKVYWQLNPEVFDTIITCAHDQGLKVTGHLPFRVSYFDAIKKGMDAVDHMDGYIEACSSVYDSIRANRIYHYAVTGGNSLKNKTYTPEDILRPTRLALEHFSKEKQQQLLQALAAGNTWEVPTLATRQVVSFMDDSLWATNKDAYDQELSYPGIIEENSAWQKKHHKLYNKPEHWEIMHRDYVFNKEGVRLMDSSGVKMLIGTDAVVPPLMTGVSTHWEMKLWREAGVSPAHILKAATLNPALFLNRTDSLGTVEKGKIADLVLLDANPLEDITNTQKINAVILNGRLFDSTRLVALRKEIVVVNKGIALVNDCITRAYQLHDEKKYKEGTLLFDSLFSTKAYAALTSLYGNQGALAKANYIAACFWALSGKIDKSFYYLNKAVKENHFSDINNMQSDQDLTVLHNTVQWNELIKSARQNKKHP